MHPLSDQKKVRCYGSKAALTAEATLLNKTDSPHVPTLSLEVAPRLNQHVNWDRKIAICPNRSFRFYAASLWVTFQISI